MPMLRGSEKVWDQRCLSTNCCAVLCCWCCAVGAAQLCAFAKPAERVPPCTGRALNMAAMCEHNRMAGLDDEFASTQVKPSCKRVPRAPA